MYLFIDLHKLIILVRGNFSLLHDLPKKSLGVVLELLDLEDCGKLFCGNLDVLSSFTTKKSSFNPSGGRPLVTSDQPIIISITDQYLTFMTITVV